MSNPEEEIDSIEEVARKVYDAIFDDLDAVELRG